MKVIIVGGVAGGASAAARIRRIDEQAHIVMYERSGHISYANCGLPYYIGETILDKDQLTLQDPESFYQRFHVQVHVHHDVQSIDSEKKTVQVMNLETGEIFSDHYDKLLLSPGARPIIPAFPGYDSEKIWTLRTVEDTLKIKEKITLDHPKKMAVIGGGFIGLEMAENLTQLGIQVTLVEAGKQLMAPFDEDMAAFLHTKVRQKGIRLLLDHAVEGFVSSSDEIEVRLNEGDALNVDRVILAIGVQPENQLAKEAGCQLGVKGHIVVNEHMETTQKDIYAVGDAVEIDHLITKERTFISLAGPANKQGRIAADNICGKESSYKGGLGSSIVKVFDMTAAVTGINEKTAKRLGLNYDKVILSPMSHASYYPGGKIMTIKVLYEVETERLLGGQIIGYDGVDKRIDVLATSIQTGLKGSDLKDLELSYAPPYSSAKDPVNMAGYIIENQLQGMMKQWTMEEWNDLQGRKDLIFLDVRTREEYETGHIDGFLHIPLDELRDQIHTLDPKKSIYVLCQSGLRSYLATRILEGNGYSAYNFAGGYRFWQVVQEEKVLAVRSFNCGMDQTI